MKEDIIERELYITCECGGEVMVLQKFKDTSDVDPYTYVSIFTQGVYPPKPNLWWRIKEAIRILTKGTLFTDQMVLCPSDTEAIIYFLQKDFPLTTVQGFTHPTKE